MKYAASVVVFALALPVAPPLSAQVMVLESLDGDETAAECQMKHTILCDYVHVDAAPTAAAIGGIVQLNGKDYVVEWSGPGYYLESGVVLEPLGPGTSDLKDQRWLEVYPNLGKVHISRSWSDVDGNRALSASDALELDEDAAVTVVDVRFQMRVSPAPSSP